MTATLQMLLDEKIGLYVSCGRCGWTDVLDGEALAVTLGHDLPIPDVPNYMICKGCGPKGRLEVQPDWPSKTTERIVNPVP